MSLVYTLERVKKKADGFKDFFLTLNLSKVQKLIQRLRRGQHRLDEVIAFRIYMYLLTLTMIVHNLT